MTQTFAEFLNAAWTDHGADAAGVATRLAERLDVAAESGQVPGYANLVVHVYGEHLGRWDDGTALLERLGGHRAADEAAVRAVRRFQAVLALCKGDLKSTAALVVAAREPGIRDESIRARVWAIAASALVGQGRGAEGARLFEEAVAAASYGPDRSDPASRALAVTGNNLACDLEEKQDRSAADTALMLKAAATARKYWEIAGGWEQVVWADYRLAMSHLAAGDQAAARAARDEVAKRIEATQRSLRSMVEELSALDQRLEK